MSRQVHGEMWLRLEDVTKELNGKKWRLEWIQRAMRELEPLLKPERAAEALTFLEDFDNKGKIDAGKIAELLRQVQALEKEQQDLKQLLGTA